MIGQFDVKKEVIQNIKYRIIRNPIRKRRDFYDIINYRMILFSP